MTPFAFIIAIVILVVVHELGHFCVARLCGVKVLCFSVGFGPRLLGWTSARSGTEFRLSALPLGGYVEMLDERNAPVEAQERAFAVNTKPLRSRVAIAAAGPLANLIMAIALYSWVNWNGIEMAQAVVSKPPLASAMAMAGLEGGERIQRAGFDGEPLEDVVSFEGLRWWLVRAAIEHRNLQIEFTVPGRQGARATTVQLSGMDVGKVDATLFQKIGVLTPFMQARVGEVVPGEAAQRAQLRPGDVVLRVDATDIVDASQLYDIVRSSGRQGDPVPQTWIVERNGARLSTTVQPALVSDKPSPFAQWRANLKAWLGMGDGSVPVALTYGRIGAGIAAPPATSLVSYGLSDGVAHAATRTWETSVLSLRVLGQIVTLQASLSNLSGPISIADHAGKSAAMGFTPFLLFLALMNVSLGVLNLLPLPVLDGGHLMYYLWEALSGKPVPPPWIERLQKLGLAILLTLMFIALLNDVIRLLW